jgi:hypothetical protein
MQLSSAVRYFIVVILSKLLNFVDLEKYDQQKIYAVYDNSPNIAKL